MLYINLYINIPDNKSKKARYVDLTLTLKIINNFHNKSTV